MFAHETIFRQKYHCALSLFTWHLYWCRNGTKRLKNPKNSNLKLYKKLHASLVPKMSAFKSSNYYIVWIPFLIKKWDFNPEANYGRNFFMFSKETKKNFPSIGVEKCYFYLFKLRARTPQGNDTSWRFLTLLHALAPFCTQVQSAHLLPKRTFL